MNKSKEAVTHKKQSKKIKYARPIVDERILFGYIGIMNKSNSTYNSNSQLDYSVEQFVLPLDLSKKIDDKDPYWTFMAIMKEVNLNKYLRFHRGNKGYNRKRMMMVVHYAQKVL